MHCFEPKGICPPYFTNVLHISGAYMGNVCAYVSIYKSLVSSMWWGAPYIYFVNYISRSGHMSLNKYSCHITNINHIALILYICGNLVLVHICTKTQPTATSTPRYCYTYARNKYTCHTVHIPYIFWAFIRNVCTCKCYILSSCYQPGYQEHCTHILLGG